MIIKLWARVLAFVVIVISGAAHAELETWRITGTVYQEKGGGFVPPSFARVGQTVTLDYVFNTAINVTPSITDNNPVVSITVNGETSSMQSYFINWDGFYAINGTPNPSRSDGVNFISWNLFGSQQIATTFADFLDGYENSSTYFSDLRIDFGANSVWLKPNVFIMTSPVPEPGTYLMVLLGLVFLRMFSLKRQTR